MRLHVMMLVLLWPSLATAATYVVTPSQNVQTIANVVQAGDVVEFSCGVYYQAARWTAHGTAALPIVLRSACATEKPIFDGTGVNISGSLPHPRALFQFEGAYYHVSNIEFRNASNGSNNGACLRSRGSPHVAFYGIRCTHSNMGVMGDAYGYVGVFFSEFGQNNKANGYVHNIYLSEGETLEVQFSWLHDAGGCNLKSRSHYTIALYNWIEYGRDAEVCLVDSSDTERSNSNAILVGNVIRSKARVKGANQLKFVDFGQDTGGDHCGTLYLVNNTLVAANTKIEFLWNTAACAYIEATNNVFYGSLKIATRYGPERVSGVSNLVPTGSVVSWGGTVYGDPLFVNAAYDYHLQAGSPAIHAGVSSTFGYDGNGNGVSTVPTMEIQFVTRPVCGPIDIGAYEYPCS